ncbi:hypothetical protein BGX29_005830 [Mortierella sp. GBA35]|nr:hypothetical protein BGX29_005830 [Mortierella sp. GBA35]
MPHSKNTHSLYDEPANSRYHPFPAQQRSPAEPWESSSEHRPPYPTAAIDIPQPPRRRSANTPNDYRRHEQLDSARGQHHGSYSHVLHQSPSGSAVGHSGFRDSFNPPRGEGPRYEFTRTNYRMVKYSQNTVSRDFLRSSARMMPCNFWGKLSRSKAALAKSKQESSAKAEPSKSEADVQSTLAGSSGQGAEMPKRPAVDAITLTDIARKKRGRGRSSTRDDNEAQGSATSDTSSSHSPTDSGQSRSQSQQQQQAEDVSMSDGDNPPPTQPSFPSSADLPDTSLKGGCQIDPLSATAPGPVPPPLSPDALPFRTHENHDKEGPAVGRKLTLSYLLA